MSLTLEYDYLNDPDLHSAVQGGKSNIMYDFQRKLSFLMK